MGTAYLFFRSDTNRVTNYPPKNATIVAFGDSLVSGYGATPGNDFVSILSRTIKRDIMNQGVSGNTTADGLLRVEEVFEVDPGIVILLLGGNDFLKRVPEPTTRANLSALIEQLTKGGAVVVLLGVRGGVFGDSSEVLFEELSEQYGTIYVPDVLDGLFLKPEFMFDGIHPNDAGYARIAERLRTVFEEYDL